MTHPDHQYEHPIGYLSTTTPRTRRRGRVPFFIALACCAVTVAATVAAFCLESYRGPGDLWRIQCWTAVCLVIGVWLPTLIGLLSGIVCLALRGSIYVLIFMVLMAVMVWLTFVSNNFVESQRATHNPLGGGASVRHSSHGGWKG